MIIDQEVRVGSVGFVPARVKCPKVISRNGFESPGSLNKNRQTARLRKRLLEVA